MKRLAIADNLYMDLLEAAWDKLEADENISSQEEMGADLCGEIEVIAIADGLFVVGIWFGLEGGRSLRAAAIDTDGVDYKLRWL